MNRGGPPGVRLTTSGGPFENAFIQTPENPLAVPLTAAAGGWRADKALLGSGGHLWFRAERSDESGSMRQIVRASTYYFFPAKHQVPTEMLRAPRGGLEIVPLRLQEHGGTREGSRWRFLVRFDNVALPGSVLRMETEGGSRRDFTADRDGIVEIELPHDFSADRLNSQEGMAAQQAFVLAARHTAGDTRYLSTYSQFYHPDRMRERNLGAGIGVFALGMLLAVPLWRRKEKKNV